MRYFASVFGTRRFGGQQLVAVVMEVTDQRHVDTHHRQLDDARIAAAASTVLTVNRTISEPARHNSATCLTLEATSEVSVGHRLHHYRLASAYGCAPICTAWVWRRGQRHRREA